MNYRYGRCEWCNTLECEVVDAPEGAICELCSEAYGYGDVIWQGIRVAENIEELADRPTAEKQPDTLWYNLGWTVE